MPVTLPMVLANARMCCSGVIRTTKSPRCASTKAAHAVRCAFSVGDNDASRSALLKFEMYFIIEGSVASDLSPCVRYGRRPVHFRQLHFQVPEFLQNRTYHLVMSPGLNIHGPRTFQE